MALLDTSSRSSSEVFAPTAGAQSESGSASTLVIDGERSNQSVTINQQLTDLGAIDLGKNIGMVAENVATSGLIVGNNIAGRSLDVVDRVTDTAIRTTGDTFRDAVGFIQGFADGAASLVRDAFRESTYQQQQAQAAASAAIADAQKTTGQAIDANTQISRDSIDLSRSVVDLTGELNAQNIAFLSDSNQLTAETLGGVVSDVTDSIGYIEQARGQESQRNLAAIQELATTVQTGGENLQANMNKAVAAIAILTVGLVAWQAVRS